RKRTARHLPAIRTPALAALEAPAGMAQRREIADLLRRRAGAAARQTAHEAVVRRAVLVASPGSLRTGHAGSAAGRPAAVDCYHDAQADPAAERADGGCGHGDDARIDLRQPRAAF